MKNEALFKTGSVYKAIATLAIPAMISILVMILYNMADMFFIGQLGDTAQVAAVSVVGPVFTILMAFGSMIGGGGCTAIAKKLGEGEAETAKQYSSLCFWVAIIVGILFGILALAFVNPLLSFLGAEGDIAPYAKTYLSWLSIGAPFILLTNALGNVIRAEGAAKQALVGNLAATLTNIILDPIFILVFKMGVGGAAIATVIGNIVGGLILLRYVLKKSTAISLNYKYALKKPQAIFNIMALGLPNASSNVLAGFAGTFSNQILVGYGTGAVAAMAASGKTTLVISMIQMGICMGVLPLIAYNYGSKNIQRIKEIIKKLAGITFTLGIVFAILCYLLRGPIVGLFIKDAEVAALGQYMVTWAVLGGPFIGFYYIATNFLQGSGNALTATFVSLLRQGIILIPLLYLFSTAFGIEGLIISHLVADISSMLIAVALCIWQYKKLLKSN